MAPLRRAVSAVPSLARAARRTLSNAMSACEEAGAAVRPLTFVRSMVLGDNHTAKWMQKTDKPSPMELINSVPPIVVHSRVVACRGGVAPALGHPVEFINLDAPEPAVCKYCGLRYEQRHAHH